MKKSVKVQIAQSSQIKAVTILFENDESATLSKEEFINTVVKALNNDKAELDELAVLECLENNGLNTTQGVGNQASNPSKRWTAYGLSESQYHTLKAVGDTLFALTENPNPNEKDRRYTAMCNCLAFLCEQLDSVIDGDLSTA